MFTSTRLLMTIGFDRRREQLATAERRHRLFRRPLTETDTPTASLIPFPATDTCSSPSRVRVA